jgi:hypothetical protein
MGASPARLSHRVPNRVRIKVKAHKGNAGYFHRAKTLVRSYPGVEAVDSNHQTASLVIKHKGPLEDILAKAEQDLLFAVIEVEPEEALIFEFLPLAGSLVVLVLWRLLCRG